MPLIVFLLVVVLIAQIGFWDTLQSFLGAVLFFVLLALVVVGVVILGGLLIGRRMTRRF
jgi:Na+/H+-dicarboxylate symporter